MLGSPTAEMNKGHVVEMWWTGAGHIDRQARREEHGFALTPAWHNSRRMHNVIELPPLFCPYVNLLIYTEKNIIIKGILNHCWRGKKYCHVIEICCTSRLDGVCVRLCVLVRVCIILFVGWTAFFPVGRQQSSKCFISVSSVKLALLG